MQIVGTLGLGGLISSCLTLLLTRRNEDKRRHQDYKETRYKCIIVLIHSRLNPERGLFKLNEQGRKMTSVKDIDDELEAELSSSYLYASDGFIAAFRAFRESPTPDNHLQVAREIRKDLWGLR